MKPDSTRAATARVLADIDAAVRPVERARTAAAVDRVLASAAPSIWGADCGDELAEAVCEEFDLGFDAIYQQHDQDCDCEGAYPIRDHATPGVSVVTGSPASAWVPALAPWNVSPHLFPTDPS